MIFDEFDPVSALMISDDRTQGSARSNGDRKRSLTMDNIPPFWNKMDHLGNIAQDIYLSESLVQSLPIN